jgi:hypothetical protein
MGVASWRPGTSRWAYLLTGIYVVFLAVALPLAIAVNSALTWVTFSLVTASGVLIIAAAYSMRRFARRTKASTTDLSPQR